MTTCPITIQLPIHLSTTFAHIRLPKWRAQARVDLVHRRMCESKGLGDRRMTDVAFVTFEWTWQKDEFIAKYRYTIYCV